MVDTIMARLASVVSDRLICDILSLLTEHANRNLVACQSDTQLKITMLLQRYLEKQPEARIDWFMLFYFEYLTARSYADRRVEISERMQDFFAILIRKRASYDP